MALEVEVEVAGGALLLLPLGTVIIAIINHVIKTSKQRHTHLTSGSRNFHYRAQAVPFQVISHQLQHD